MLARSVLVAAALAASSALAMAQGHPPAAPGSPGTLPPGTATGGPGQPGGGVGTPSSGAGIPGGTGPAMQTSPSGLNTGAGGTTGPNVPPPPANPK
jgi:hypothetical protein